MIEYHMELMQGTDEWFEARLGVLTASTMGKLFTAGLKPSKGKTPESLMYKLISERVTGWVPDGFTSYDMERGHYEEDLAIEVYSREREPVTTCGFVTNTKYGFKMGYSPDGLVGDDGLLEVKSKKHEFQIRAIFESMIFGDSMPDEHAIQVQTGLLVTERKWCDFISYSNGLPMAIIRAEPDKALQKEILSVAIDFEVELAKRLSTFNAAVADRADLIPTERNDFIRDGMEF